MYKCADCNKKIKKDTYKINNEVICQACADYFYNCGFAISIQDIYVCVEDSNMTLEKN